MTFLEALAVALVSGGLVGLIFRFHFDKRLAQFSTELKHHYDKKFAEYSSTLSLNTHKAQTNFKRTHELILLTQAQLSTVKEISGRVTFTISATYRIANGKIVPLFEDDVKNELKTLQAFYSEMNKNFGEISLLLPEETVKAVSNFLSYMQTFIYTGVNLTTDTPHIVSGVPFLESSQQILEDIAQQIEKLFKEILELNEKPLGVAAKGSE